MCQYMWCVCTCLSNASVAAGSFSTQGTGEQEAEEMTDGLGDIQQIMQTCSTMGLGP